MSKYAQRFISLFVFMACVSADDNCCWAENRSINGTGNNLNHSEWGATVRNFDRGSPVAYGDGISSLAGPDRPEPRVISNALFAQTDPRPNRSRLSGYVYAFGQFLSHDIQETLSDSTESIDFRIPRDDEFFRGESRFPLTRSFFDPETGTGPDNPRQQVNFTTAYIDASPVYGSDENLASILRGGPGNPTAKLRTSNDINGDGENLLPRDVFGPFPEFPFIAGDVRVNDTVVLASMHTLFMREHNRLVDSIASQHPDWSDEDLYQRARKIVGAQVQVITYNEFLPAMLGPHAPSPDGEYDPTLQAGVFNEFSTVFLRVGHSMLTPDFKRVQNDGTPSPEGPLPLEDAFFNPLELQTAAALEAFLKGLSTEVQEEVDLGLVDGMRIAALGAIDIQRARDHGLADYNTMRESFGLPRVSLFEDISSSLDVQTALAAVYDDVDSIDPFVGALAEQHLPGATVGPLVAAAFTAQFERLRDGDRFWYQNDSDFSLQEIEELSHTRLSDIIHRNTGLTSIQGNAFVVPEPSGLFSFYVALGLSAFLRRRACPRPVR